LGWEQGKGKGKERERKGKGKEREMEGKGRGMGNDYVIPLNFTEILLFYDIERSMKRDAKLTCQIS
jgi:hypothetical protein